MNGFQKAQQDYETRMSAPFDYYKSEDELLKEYEEKQDYLDRMANNAYDERI